MAEAVKKPNADEIYQGLTGTQKCAILMMLIGEDEAAEIMGNLSPKEVQVLGSAMYSVQGLLAHESLYLFVNGEGRCFWVRFVPLLLFPPRQIDFVLAVFIPGLRLAA